MEAQLGGSTPHPAVENIAGLNTFGHSVRRQILADAGAQNSVACSGNWKSIQHSVHGGNGIARGPGPPWIFLFRPADRAARPNSGRHEFAVDLHLGISARAATVASHNFAQPSTGTTSLLLLTRIQKAVIGHKTATDAVQIIFSGGGALLLRPRFTTFQNSLM
ncbi:hypothetical protein KCP69_01795 [Salmonella enterica subsp. enterica]|nr:hypothetical protein KCP69_01795 [Salmonella enterica subsp. enterica]